MLINDYWLATTKDSGFFLIEQPSLKVFQQLKTYHQILVSIARSNPEILATKSDEILYFGSYGSIYHSIADLLTPKFDCSLLDPESRYQLFIAFEPRGSLFISGLELLLGLDFRDSDSSSDNKPENLSITSGNLEIDLVAELLLHIDSGRIEWLISNKSPQFLIKLVKQMSDRSRGQEAIEELQQKNDLEKISQNSKVSQELKESGFNF